MILNDIQEINEDEQLGRKTLDSRQLIKKQPKSYEILKPQLSRNTFAYVSSFTQLAREPQRKEAGSVSRVKQAVVQ